MTDAKITVIIPVYNVEPYLHQCLDSVINQTYQNLEIIIVDDGSPDRCGEICDEYALKDSRIQVIHKKNGGLSAARNDALKKVTGEWISFVDSDDWCELDLYEKVIEKACESQAEIVMFSLFRNLPNSEERISAFDRDFETSDRKTISSLQYSALSYRYNPYPSASLWGQGFPWDKLFKTSLIKDHNLRFAENIRANEDVIFNIHAFQHATKVKFFDLPLYHWRLNPESIGHKYTADRPEVDQEIYEEMIRIGEEYNLPNEYYQAVDVRTVENVIRMGRRCFFHRERKESFPNKIKFATQVLHTEPFYSAYKLADKKKLSKSGKLVTVAHSGLLLYIVTILRRALNID